MKKRRWIYLPIIVFLIGCIYTILIYNGIWFKLTSGLKSLSLIGYLLWFIFAFYFTLTLHELGHFLAFHFQKVKLRAIYLTIFVFYKDSKGWHFTIKPKLWILLGGLVVPDLGEIKNEEEYKSLSSKFSKSLIAAPIVTITLLILTLVTFVLLMIFGTHTHFNGIFTINTLYITLLSLFYIYTFKLSNQMFYGDFVAHKKMNSDEIFQLAEMNQYTMFSSEESEESVRFLWEKSKTIIQDKPVSTTMFYIMILTNYLDGIIRNDYEIDEKIDEKLKGLNLSALCRTEHGLSIAYDLCFYDYKKGLVEQAFKRFELIQRKTGKKLDEKMVLYLRNKSAHLMHLEDQSLFLSDRENIYIGSAWIFEVLLNPYEMLEAYHKPLPYQEYSCPVVFKEETEEKSDLS